MNAFVITVVGPDRPGLVDQLSEAIEKAGGNWLESRLAHLGGHFAGIVRAEGPAELERALEAVADLKITVHPDQPEHEPPSQDLHLELVGQDRPGIVHQITAALARHRVNIEEFSSQRKSAPMAGGMLFSAQISVGLPANCDLDGLRRELEAIAEDLMCDFNFDAQALSKR